MLARRHPAHAPSNSFHATRTRYLEGFDKFAVTASNFVDGFLSRDLIGSPIHQRIPKTCAAYQNHPNNCYRHHRKYIERRGIDEMSQDPGALSNPNLQNDANQ